MIAEVGVRHRRADVHAVLGGDDRGVGEAGSGGEVAPVLVHVLGGYAELGRDALPAVPVGFGDRDDPGVTRGDGVPGVCLTPETGPGES
ncbi:hypothetical protein Ahu01nite_040010 [Winogradskya humida]|uniref:Uncharacterized protein n=1 Tax=Winogradskya humida TaxID=113566 RepID=A0ABQ3ZQP4_9ACTN|nr:hypothetical protein Ahu01nite_040010 [Actinoplanes humidus]